MSAFDAPLSPNISHFSSSGPDTHGGVGAFASDVHHTSRTQPRVHLYSSVYTSDDDRDKPPPLEYSSDEDEGCFDDHDEEYFHVFCEEGEFDCLPPPKKCSTQGKTDFSRGYVVSATSGDCEQSQPTLGVVKSGDDVSLLKHGTPVCKLSRIVSCFIPDVPKAGGSRNQIPFMPPEMYSISKHIDSHDGKFFVNVHGQEVEVIDDIAQLQPLVPETTTEQLFVMFDGTDVNDDIASDLNRSCMFGGDGNCDSVADGLDVMMHEADQSAAPPKSMLMH